MYAFHKRNRLGGVVFWMPIVVAASIKGPAIFVIGEAAALADAKEISAIAPRNERQAA